MLQPWASLVIWGAKEYECRSWQTGHRGPLLIYASAKKPSRRGAAMFEQALFFRNYIKQIIDLPYGCLIGTVKLVHIFETNKVKHHLSLQELAFDDYTPGRFAWHLEGATSLPYFLPMKGNLGLWNYDGLL